MKLASDGGYESGQLQQQLKIVCYFHLLIKLMNLPDLMAHAKAGSQLRVSKRVLKDHHDVANNEDYALLD